ncbi:hypothetical protein N7495_009582 [Penicillium taxi]|uniref:uncharacterized protein n=1 Tax=Penicillium taxi TaxID=168475 RepID=UPI002545A876|nr:uncharacterized protein N7495_009582 [Penicillium taxi]KAJ5885072.1 hypothetical protein N7495_009582 [Penicillium taxi]
MESTLVDLNVTEIDLDLMNICMLGDNPLSDVEFQRLVDEQLDADAALEMEHTHNDLYAKWATLPAQSSANEDNVPSLSPHEELWPVMHNPAFIPIPDYEDPATDTFWQRLPLRGYGEIDTTPPVVHNALPVVPVEIAWADWVNVGDYPPHPTEDEPISLEETEVATKRARSQSPSAPRKKVKKAAAGSPSRYQLRPRVSPATLASPKPRQARKPRRK